MMREVRSELLRLRRPSMVIAWFGLTVVSALMVSTVMFSIVGEQPTPPANGPGVSFPTLAELESRDGIVASIGAASSIFGVITLAFWAIAGGTDYSSGLIRVLVAAQPRRWRLLAGKAVALSKWTAVAALIALAVTLLVAPAGASAAGIDTSAWGTAAVGILLRGYVDLLLSLFVWGAIGLALTVVTRSAAVAIGVGIGYVMVVEGVIKAASQRVGDWLPGTTISALAQGGSDALSYEGALGLGALYLALAMGTAFVVLWRRDVTD